MSLLARMLICMAFKADVAAAAAAASATALRASMSMPLLILCSVVVWLFGAVVGEGGNGNASFLTLEG